MVSTKAVLFYFLVIIGTSWFTGGDRSGLAFAQALPGYPNKQNYELLSPCYQANGQSGPCPQQNSRLENPGQQYSYQYPEYNVNQQLNNPYDPTRQQVIVLSNPNQQYVYQQSGPYDYVAQKPTVVFVPQLSSDSYSQNTGKYRFEGRPILSFLHELHNFKMNLLDKITGGR